MEGCCFFYPHIFSPSFSLSCFLCMICIRGSFLFCCLFFSSASFFPENYRYVHAFSICVCIEGVGTQGRGKGEEGGGRGRELGGGMFCFFTLIFFLHLLASVLFYA